MKLHLLHFSATFLAAMCASVSTAQVPSDIGDRLKSIGRVVDVSGTVQLYQGRVLETSSCLNLKVERDVRYGADEKHLLDVFAPSETSTKALPVLIYVPGGGFVNPARRVPNSAYFDSLMTWAACNGMVGVNMSYRVLPKDAWPAGAEDVGMVVRWVHEQIAARGGDPKRVFLFAHSAGAAHAASYLADERFQNAAGAGLAGALLLSGIYRLTPDLAATASSARAYFGDDAAKYEERSAQRGLVALAARLPFWVGFAELDPARTEVAAQDLYDGMCKAGHCPTFVKFPGHSHMSEMFSIGTADRSVSDSILAFVRSH
ncbi:alpha/beta hydrolase [Variovorax sp. J22R133]|uniref:alpha/beta hydrolase n=1 Tax=Variovorax brevis TaxID=3053503 RepID=UPI002574B432|nr:alpha/beta hydrolase [Variovorax sp. J22R133]MDM0118008.1 alpha/beta hydrolase [Variovorax sp. J22R133]